jgi:hypothetical protein
MYGQSQCHYHDQKNGGGNNYRLTHGVIVAGMATPSSCSTSRSEDTCSLAIFAAIRRALSRLSNLAAGKDVRFRPVLKRKLYAVVHGDQVA